jgi:hypothetical protein
MTLPQDPTSMPWRQLRERLDGYFAASAKGLLGSELSLSSRSGEEFGRLRVEGLEGARLEAGGARATIERVASASRYRMLADNEEVLVEVAGGTEASQAKLGERLYEIRLSPLRNTAVARSTEGSEAARVAGGLINRSYEASFDVRDEGSLSLAFFLLYRIVALRSRAFLTGAGGGEAARS